MKSNLSKLDRQREAILRFYATMENRDYDDVVDDYMGVSKTNTIISNRLYMATEMAISYMNEAES